MDNGYVVAIIVLGIGSIALILIGHGLGWIARKVGLWSVNEDNMLRCLIVAMFLAQLGMFFQTRWMVEAQTLSLRMQLTTLQLMVASSDKGASY